MQSNQNQNANPQQGHQQNDAQANHKAVHYNEKGQRALRRYKKIAWFTGICGLLLLIIGIVMPIILINFIKSQAKDQVVMQSSNYDQWGQIPGDTGMVLERQFTFYNWTNSENFFVYGDKPILYESQPVYFQEFQNFTNPQYNEDGTIVTYQFQEFFLPIKNSTGNEIQTTVNLGPMGFWYQIKQATRVQIGIQAFYGLFSGMVDQILESLQIGQISMLTITNLNQWNQFLKKVEDTNQMNLMIQSQQNLYEDPSYGFKANSYIWMAAYNEFKNGNIENKSTCIFLTNYFNLDYNNLSYFFTQKDGVFQASIQFAKQFLIQPEESFGCTQTDEEKLRACLAAGQWAELKTGQSITAQNSTATGYPEIISFQQNYFLLYINSAQKYQDIEFNREWAEKVTYYIQNPKDANEFTKNTNTLLNQGNLGVLYTNGDLYDQTNDVKYLQVIADRFEINEHYFGVNYLDATYLFWEYAKYIVDIFAESKNLQGGGSAIAGLTGIASQGLYTVFQETQDTLAISFIQVLIFAFFKGQGVENCAQFKEKVNTFLNTNYDLCADGSPFKEFNTDSTKVLYECNMYQSFSSYCQSLTHQFQDKNFLTNLFAVQIIQQAIQFADQQMFNTYKCQGKLLKCSYYEIAAYQWYNMAIIRNIPEVIKPYVTNKGTETLKQWVGDLLPHAYEWGYYQEHFGIPYQDLDYQKLSTLLSFNFLFSGTKQIQMFLNDQDFKDIYYFTNASYLRDYIRWITAFTAFGLTQTRKANDLLSGYKDDFLFNIASMNPQEGGDPSTGFMLNFNDINMTDPSTFQKQAMYTGKGNYSAVRQYKEVNGLDYVSFLKPSFDGFEVSEDFVTPWAKNIPIVGTDAGSNKPDIGKDTDLTIFVTTIYTGGTVSNTGKESDFHGINTYKYEISGCILRNASVCSQNADVYSYYYDYSINLTSILQAPVFNTKTHMYQMEPNMSERIELYNKDGNLQYPNEWDDTYMLVEPYSGVSLGITLNLQGVLLFEPDILFNKLKEPVMIPFFSVYRAGNFTEEKVDEIYGALKAGLLIQDLVLYIGCSLGGILLLAFAYSIFAIIKIRKVIKPTGIVEDTTQERLIDSQTYL